MVCSPPYRLRVSDRGEKPYQPLLIAAIDTDVNVRCGDHIALGKSCVVEVVDAATADKATVATAFYAMNCEHFCFPTILRMSIIGL